MRHKRTLPLSGNCGRNGSLLFCVIDKDGWIDNLSDRRALTELALHEDCPRWLRATGYYSDLHQEQTCVPIVVRLPHGRLLSGYYDDEGLRVRRYSACAVIDTDIVYDMRTAIIEAHRLAERAAEESREFYERQCTECCGAPRDENGQFPDLCAECAQARPDYKLALHATA